MMDDRFLRSLEGEPRPEFARELRARLAAQGEPAARRWRPPVPVLAGALAAALAVALFTMPSVRASAQAMLDLFRIRTFAVVQFDQARIDRLRALKTDNALLVFDREQRVVEPGPRQYYPTLEAAGTAARLDVRRPTYLPNGLTPDSVFVQGAADVRLGISESRLRGLLDQLDLRDVTVPPGLDSKWIEVRKPPVVLQQFRNSGSAKAQLVQATSPEVSVPAGLEVERLAEIGLRVLGLDAGEAHRIAASTDWRSTLLVPVPVNASTFRQVTIHGQHGLLITMAGRGQDGERRRQGSVVLWSENDHVYAVMGTIGGEDLVQMAESVR